MMQFIKSLFTLCMYLLPFIGSSQTTYIPMGSKEYILIDRLEIKTKHPDLYFSHVKPYSRKLYTRQVEYIDSLSFTDEKLSKHC